MGWRVQHDGIAFRALPETAMFARTAPRRPTQLRVVRQSNPELDAYNLAFDELELDWHWDQSILDELAGRTRVKGDTRTIDQRRADALVALGELALLGRDALAASGASDPAEAALMEWTNTFLKRIDEIRSAQNCKTN